MFKKGDFMSHQKWNATEYETHVSFVPALANDVIELLNPREGERILDIGCGDGQLTLKIKEKGCSVLGIDFSANMVEAAIRRGVEAILMDGHNIHFIDEFDAVFSNAALHWFTEPEKVIESVYRALKHNGRFVGEFGGKGNISALIEAMQEVFNENGEFGNFKLPWYFPGATEYKASLEKHGFKVNYIELIPRPTPLESGIEKWLEIFAQSIISHLSSDQKRFFLQAVKEKVTPVLYSNEKGWVADYVRLRFKASK